jgi:hypothetical protein
MFDNRLFTEKSIVKHMHRVEMSILESICKYTVDLQNFLYEFKLYALMGKYVYE